MEETDEMAMIMPYHCCQKSAQPSICKRNYSFARAKRIKLEQLMRTNSVYNKINSDSNFAV